MAKMNVDPNKGISKMIRCWVQHYDPEKYWRRRAIVVDPKSRVPKLIKLYYLYYIKKCDAFNCASLGTDLNQGAEFATPPELPHGLNGIIVHMKAKIGKNAFIWQQVVIVSYGGGTPVIGDDVKIGTGAKIIGGVKVGNNVFIGANAVVVDDIPDNCIVGGIPAKVIKYVDGPIVLKGPSKE